MIFLLLFVRNLTSYRIEKYNKTVHVREVDKTEPQQRDGSSAPCCLQIPCKLYNLDMCIRLSAEVHTDGTTHVRVESFAVTLDPVLQGAGKLR